MYNVHCIDSYNYWPYKHFIECLLLLSVICNLISHKYLATFACIYMRFPHIRIFYWKSPHFVTNQTKPYNKIIWIQRHFHSIEMNTLNIHVREAIQMFFFFILFPFKLFSFLYWFFCETFRAKLRPDQNLYKIEFLYRKYDEPRKIRLGFTHLRNGCISKDRIFHQSKSFQRVIIKFFHWNSYKFDCVSKILDKFHLCLWVIRRGRVGHSSVQLHMKLCSFAW